MTFFLSFNDIGNLYISNASVGHEGIYICQAENNGGVAEKTTYLRLNGKQSNNNVYWDSHSGQMLCEKHDHLFSV